MVFRFNITGVLLNFDSLYNGVMPRFTFNGSNRGGLPPVRRYCLDLKSLDLKSLIEFNGSETLSS